MSKVSTGNYRGYYKLRPDPIQRLASLNQEWFSGKTCLDVGCNDGQLCLAIAEHLSPAMILGIDPDFVLIDSAKSRLKRIAHSKFGTDTKDSTSNTDVLVVKQKPLIKPITGFLPRNIAVKTAGLIQPPKQMINTNQHNTNAIYPNNIQFKACDIFDLSCNISSVVEGKYDVITCFSVTKWIHLNGGDLKLIELFCRLYSLVRKGGRVIIEYQTWKSYENNKHSSGHVKEIFPTIKIRPELFEELLINCIGFEVEQHCGATVEEAKGFNRPILILKRPVHDVTRSITTSVGIWRNEHDFPHILATILAGKSLYNRTDTTNSITTKADSYQAHIKQDQVENGVNRLSKKRLNSENSSTSTTGTSMDIDEGEETAISKSVHTKKHRRIE